MKNRVGRGTSWMRWADRYLGTIAIATLGLWNSIFLWRSRSRVDIGFERICLLKTTAIGDTVLLLSVVQALREKYPHVVIDLYCGPSNYAFAILIPGLDSVVKLPVTNPWLSLHILRQKHYDAVLDFGPWSRLEAIYARIVPANFRAGFKCAGQFRHYAYDVTVEHDGNIHELENYKNLCSLIGVQALPIPQLAWIERPTTALNKLNLAPHKYAVLHLWPGGSRSEDKEWPVEHWLQLIAYLGRELKLSIVLSGALADKAKNAEINTLTKASSVEVVNAAGVSLEDSITLLSQARLVVSVDTGIMHIASALGQLLVALHGPTHSDRWGSRSLKTRSLNACRSIAEAPISLGFEQVSEPLMARIKPEQVITEVNLLLKTDC